MTSNPSKPSKPSKPSNPSKPSERKRNLLYESTYVNVPMNKQASVYTPYKLSNVLEHKFDDTLSSSQEVPDGDGDYETLLTQPLTNNQFTSNPNKPSGKKPTYEGMGKVSSYENVKPFLYLKANNHQSNTEYNHRSTDSKSNENNNSDYAHLNKPPTTTINLYNHLNRGSHYKIPRGTPVKPFNPKFPSEHNVYADLGIVNQPNQSTQPIGKPIGEQIYENVDDVLNVSNKFLSKINLQIIDNKLIFKDGKYTTNYDPLYVFIIELIKNYQTILTNKSSNVIDEIYDLYKLINQTKTFTDIINKIATTFTHQTEFYNKLRKYIVDNKKIRFNLNYILTIEKPYTEDTFRNLITNFNKDTEFNMDLLRASMDYIMICYLDLFLRKIQINLPNDILNNIMNTKMKTQMNKKIKKVSGGNRSKLTKLTKKHINKNKKKTHYRNGTSKKTTTQRKK